MSSTVTSPQADPDVARRGVRMSLSAKIIATVSAAVAVATVVGVVAAMQMTDTKAKTDGLVEH